MKKRRICVVTSSRADYGLLYWLMKEIIDDSNLELQIIATGMHLSPEFGLTYKEIEKEFKINKKIEILLSSDTSIGISKSMGLALISFAEAYGELNPSIVVVLGDRFEIFCAATSAMVARLPIAHIHGGESTEGLIDEAIRHSISKMSHLHFTSTEQYRKRVIQLGENPERVFNVGAMGIENIRRLSLLSRDELEKTIGFKFNRRNILVTFHPVTLEGNTSKIQFQEILKAVDQLEHTSIIFTMANSDTDGRIINKMIVEYVEMNSNKSVYYISLGKLAYLSILQYVDAILGNSSSGIIEAPSFKIGTINIGDRQRGRIKSSSVIDCSPNREEILKAISVVYSNEFQTKLKTVHNPYEGVGYPSKKIVRIIKEIDLQDILKKSFFDIEG